jgi:hypothetical protein
VAAAQPDRCGKRLACCQSKDISNGGCQSGALSPLVRSPRSRSLSLKGHRAPAIYKSNCEKHSKPDRGARSTFWCPSPWRTHPRVPARRLSWRDGVLGTYRGESRKA